MAGEYMIVPSGLKQPPGKILIGKQWIPAFMHALWPVRAAVHQPANFAAALAINHQLVLGVWTSLLNITGPLQPPGRQFAVLQLATAPHHPYASRGMEVHVDSQNLVDIAMHVPSV